MSTENNQSIVTEERDTVLCGVKIGEHSFEPEAITAEIKERVLSRGCNLVYIRPKFNTAYPQENFINWARFLAENKIYFHFGYTVQHPPKGQESQFTPETVAKMREVAGEYFLGDAISEPGTTYAAKAPGYFRNTPRHPRDGCDQTDGFESMAEAHAHYLKTISGYAAVNKKLGMPNNLSIEATALAKYNLEAGVDIPTLEMMNGNPDIMVPTIRGAARAYGAKMWGTLIAHEWYGGFRHEDILKRKRHELAWKYIYMQGTGTIMYESGDEEICSYGHRYTADSPLVQEFRKTIETTVKYINSDCRPKGGPKCEVAFVWGRHDAWTGFCQSSVWNQFYREEWGQNDPEYSWRILDELGAKRQWADVANFGDHDTSAYPAYGTYDIIPIEAPLEVLTKYKYLIFIGWNSMTDADMDKLYSYVENGGKLLMGAAHLNTNTARDGKFIPVSQEKIEKLFGCRLTGETERTNFGTKFMFNSQNEGMLYPGSYSFICDPLYSAGYVEYAKTELCGAEPLGFISDCFWDDRTDINSVLEHRIGKGCATLVTSINYPGNPALYPLYRAMVREFVTASARNCDLTVCACDRLRYTVYENGKMYLLNTDYDMPIAVKVIHNGKEQVVTLDSLELKTIQI